MRRRLAGGCGAVVAAGAGARDGRVVEMDRRPVRRDVAILTDVVGGNVCGRLAGGRCAVVTAGASAGHIGVVEMDHRPASRDVAVLADIARCDVGWRLPSGRGAIMATGAGAGDAAVVEAGAAPGRCPVAVLAGCGRGDVCRRLSWRSRAVVACRATAQRLAVVEPAHRVEIHIAVTIRALARCRKMHGGKPGRARSVVAGTAFRRRSRKHAVHMAGLAFNSAMGARKREARPIVIECDASLALSQSGRGKRQDKKNAEEDAPPRRPDSCEHASATTPKHCVTHL